MGALQAICKLHDNGLFKRFTAEGSFYVYGEYNVGIEGE